MMGSSEKVFRYLYKGSFCLLIYIILSASIANIGPLEFISLEQKDEYDFTIVLAAPLITFLIVIFDYLKNRQQRFLFLNFILGIPLSIIMLFIVGFLSAHFNTYRYNEKILFKNRFSEGQSIVSRSNWSDNNSTIHKVTQLSGGFQWTVKSDTSGLSLYEWVPVNQ